MVFLHPQFIKTKNEVLKEEKATLTLSFDSTEHELEDQVNEWANMTGFLLALGGVCLQRKSPAGLRGFEHSKKSTG